MSSRDWTLVTVSHNSALHLRSCWAGADLGSAHWVVVDNASTDDSVAVARSLGAEVIECPDNRGFGVANNVALDRVATTWTAFVNPDVTIPAAADLDRLAAAARRSGGLVAPQLLNTDGTEQLNARGLPYPSQKLANRGMRLPGVDPTDYARAGFTSPTYIAWAMGAAVAGPTTLFRSLGGWDERYFIYYEDHDLGLRAWRSGHPVVLDPAVRWVHHWQRATTRLRLDPWRHELRSMRTFYRTYPSLRSRRRQHPPWLQEVEKRLWTPARTSDAAGG